MKSWLKLSLAGRFPQDVGICGSTKRLVYSLRSRLLIITPRHNKNNNINNTVRHYDIAGRHVQAISASSYKLWSGTEERNLLSISGCTVGSSSNFEILTNQFPYQFKFTDMFLCN